MQNKLVEVLQSRKFWSSVIGILSVVGIYSGSDIQAAELVDAIMVIVSAYIVGTGIESGLKNKG